MLKKCLCFAVSVCFFFTSLTPAPQAHADTLNLPAPGTMIDLSPAYQPVIIKGVTIHKDNPFLFDFIVDVGQDHVSGDALKAEGERLIKYFLAGLAIPDKQLWVNLSPYEKNKIIPEALGQTDMGRDLLEQDYILKQITASLIYPEKQLGKTFWDTVYAKAQSLYGTTQIPVNTFNKVWIMADKAEVFAHNQSAFVVNCHLKVMLEEDYLALTHHVIPAKAGIHSLSSQIVRQIVLPELEKEVNTGRNFANLRQIFNSVVLSAWYKRSLKQALLNQVYANKSKVNGINLNDPAVKQQIYQQYLEAYKKGVFNYIKDDVNAASGEHMPRKYFSGGTVLDLAQLSITKDPASFIQSQAQGDQNGEVDMATLVSPEKINTADEHQMAEKGNNELLQMLREALPKTAAVVGDGKVAIDKKARNLVEMIQNELASRSLETFSRVEAISVAGHTIREGQEDLMVQYDIWGPTYHKGEVSKILKDDLGQFYILFKPYGIYFSGTPYPNRIFPVLSMDVWKENHFMLSNDPTFRQDRAMAAGVNIKALHDAATVAALPEVDMKKFRIARSWGAKVRPYIGKNKLLTPKDLEVMAKTTLKYAPIFNELLAERDRKQAAVDRGEDKFDFMPPDTVVEDAYGNKMTAAEIRSGDWKVSPVPEQLSRPGAIITGPWATYKWAMNALSSGAVRLFWDREDAGWDKDIEGLKAQQVAKDIINGTVTEYTEPSTGKKYTVPADRKKWPIITFRPRGIHMPGKFFFYDNLNTPGIIEDVVTYVGANHKALLEENNGIHLVFAKLQTAAEVKAAVEMKRDVEREYGLVPGTIKIILMVETIELVLELEEAEWAGREDIEVLNVGRYDKGASDIRVRAANKMWDKLAPELGKRSFEKNDIPDPELVGVDAPHMKAYIRRTTDIALKHGAEIEGGMFAFMKSRGVYPNLDKQVSEMVTKDKTVERDEYGMKFAWSASPAVVPEINHVFQSGDYSNRKPQPYGYTEQDRDDLIRLPALKGTRTRVAVKKAIYYQVAYSIGQRTAGGAVAILLPQRGPGWRVMQDFAIDKQYYFWTWWGFRWGLKLDGEDTVMDSRLLNELINEVIDDIKHMPEANQYSDVDWYAVDKEVYYLNIAPKLLWESNVMNAVIDDNNKAAIDRKLEAIVSKARKDAAMSVDEINQRLQAVEELLKKETGAERDEIIEERAWHGVELASKKGPANAAMTAQNGHGEQGDGLNIKNIDEQLEKQNNRIVPKPKTGFIPTKRLGAEGFNPNKSIGDKAVLANPNGGIDLNTTGMHWTVSKDGNGVEINLDPAMLAHIKEKGIDYLSPVIFKMTPVNIWSLAGIRPPVQLAKA